tara:strand:+ start:4233 stop:5975 length:1743 start_codon:yes stop_codon:yes gene_type:complete
MDKNDNKKFQISGIDENYSYNGKQNLSFDASSISQSGYSDNKDLSNAVKQQRQYEINNTSFSPNSTFYNPLTNSANYQNINDLSQFNIKENFQENKPIQKMLNTKYQDDTIYNNLNENLLKESITEIRLNIDSIDRDIELYPNPFEYVVNLGPVVNSGLKFPPNRVNLKKEVRKLDRKLNKVIRHTEESVLGIQQNNDIPTVNNLLFTSPDLIKKYTINLERINNPYLTKSFDNIKFIRLDTAVLPRFNKVMINCEWNYCRENYHKKKFIKDDYERVKDYTLMNLRYIPNDETDSTPIGDRFVQIFIGEINNNNNFGTNKITDTSFIMIFDKILGTLYFKLTPYSAIKTYKDSLLGNLNKLTIKFYNSWGEPLTLNTDTVNYEINQIKNTDLVIPTDYNICEVINNNEHKRYYIEKINEIIKCFVAINYDIYCKIPFYSSKNMTDLKGLCFNEHCIDIHLITLNQSIFEVKNIYQELNEFVTSIGFIDVVKKTKKNKCVKLSINEYIDNIIWYSNDPNNENLNKNIEAINNNYVNFGFNILDKLKIEIINLPASKVFQNYLTFVMGQYTNELNTKIDYNN